MELRVLGPLRLVAGERTASPKGHRPRDVLAVLAMRRGRAADTKLLRELVWADTAVTDATVHTVIARLRRQLGPTLVDRSELGYVLGSGVGVDAQAFSDHVRASRAADHAGRWREAERECRAALALWTGEPYAGVREELVLLERTRLDDLRRWARIGLVHALLRPNAGRGAALEAADVARVLVEESPLDETVALLGMRSAVAIGDQTAALALFDGLRRGLRRDLGVDPGAEVSSLYERILRQENVIDALEAAPVRVHSAAPPVPMTRTVGRDADLARVIAALTEGARVVTLVGPGGVGKSRMLAELSLRLADERMLYVWLGGLGDGDGDAVARAIAGAGGIRVEGTDTARAVALAFGQRAITLLLDEAEWAAPAVAVTVGTVLSTCPQVRAIVTSRRPLDLTGERRVPIGPLELPVSDEAGAVRASPAVRLLAARLTDRAAGPSADPQEWSAVELATLARVAVLTEGLPLAIELVAAQAGPGGLDALALVESGILDLSTARQGDTDRHESLRQTLMSSLERLPADDRRALSRLALLAGRFDAATARAVIGILPGGRRADDAVRSLVADSLLQVDQRPAVAGSVLRLLRPVREMALAELPTADRIATSRRHREWFAGRWQGMPVSDELIADVAATHDDHVAALEDALREEDADVAADLAIALARLWLLRESNGIPLPWVDAVLTTPGISEANRARLLVVRSALSHGVAQTEDDLRAPLRGDGDWTALAVHLEAIRAYMRGDFAQAVALVEDMIDLAQTGARQHLPEALASLAAFSAAEGNRERAHHFVTEALALVGPRASLVQSLSTLPKIGLALLDLGDPPAELRLLERAAELSQDRLGLPPSSSVTINAGWAALASDQLEQARHWFTLALQMPGASGIASIVGEALSGLGCVFAATGDERARDALTEGATTLAAHSLTLTPMMAELVDRARSRVPIESSPRPARDLELTLAIVLADPESSP